MFDEPIDRAQWLATYIMPIEHESRGWLRRVAPAGLEVDDVIQEAYKILAGLADVSRIANPRAYFYQVIKSVISEHLRRASVARGAVANPQILPEQEGLTPERIVSGREDLAGLYRAITRLPEPCRAIFIFRKIDNLSQKEIAAKLRVSENTVEKQIARGLRIILTQLKADSESGHAAPRVPSPKEGGLKMDNNSQAIEEAATEWVARIDRGLDRAEERALEDWLASDQQCRDALNVAQAVWRNLDRAQVFKIAAEQGHQVKVARRNYKPFAYAAGLALLAVTSATTWMSYVRTHASTRTGEIRQVPLDDGSRMTLDTRTRLVIDYGSRARIVRLEAGEALFEVAKDPTRPFVVQAGNIKVQAIGTAFVVRKSSDRDVDVTVTQGAVEVSSSERPLESVVRVKAGSSTSLEGEGAIAAPRNLTASELERATEWTSGTLDLDDTTLAQAAAQINRYNTRQVLISDSRLAAQTLVGHVSMADPLAFAEAAAAMLDATVRTDGNQIVLEPAAGAAKK